MGGKVTYVVQSPPTIYWDFPLIRISRGIVGVILPRAVLLPLGVNCTALSFSQSNCHCTTNLSVPIILLSFCTPTGPITQLVFTFFHRHIIILPKSRMPKYNLHHQDLVHVGVNTHPDIDDHINSTVDPHGPLWIQDTLVTDNISNTTIEGVTFNNGAITGATIPAIQFGFTDNTPITYMSKTTVQSTPTTAPWVTPPTVDFSFLRINNVCKMVMTYNQLFTVVGSPTTTPFTWTGIIPTDMRPVSDIDRPHCVLHSNTMRILCTLTIGSSGDVTISPGWPPSTSSSWTYNVSLEPVNEVWTV